MTKRPARGRIRGIHTVRKLTRGKPVRWYVYAYRGGPCILKSTGPKAPELGPVELRAIAEAQADRSAPDPTKFFSLIREWRSGDPSRPSSPEWDGLSENTKKTWGSALSRIEEKWGDLPIAVFNDPRMKAKVVAWRDSRRETPRAADIGITVLHALLRFGALRGKVHINVASGIPALYRGGDRAEIIWTEPDLAAFAAKAAELGVAAAADGLLLAAATGLRREDLVTLTDAQVAEFAIVKRARKSSRGRRRFATIPRIPELDELLDKLKSRPRRPGVVTVLVDNDGCSWTPDRLTKAIAKVRDALGIVHIDQESSVVRKKHLHDARGTYATRLMLQTDLNDIEIADIMAWSQNEVGRIRKVYVDQDAKVVAIGERIARGVNRRCKPD